LDSNITQPITENETMEMVLTKNSAEDLVDSAINRDSGDNVTVMIVKIEIKQ
jgi:serine/threonine protein phosphatase PrpC